ncbi:hypothetical protein N8261_03480 [Flavobacteriaceae bacterium]|nr:hypothetical protein [Flavobacteriaceae bacterium]
MFEILFILFVIGIFIYLVYQQVLFQKYLYFSSDTKEGFTPLEVNKIIQSPGSTPIGKTDTAFLQATKLLTVSNGYNNDIINNLKVSKPEPYHKSVSDDAVMGEFPQALEEKYSLPTTEFEYPNKYKFTVDYKCRKSATGMFSDCGVYSADTAWSADPYKGLNCPLSNTVTPNHSNDVSRERGIEYNSPRKTGISGTGNSQLR